jgi:hypothetical protein
MMRPAIRLAIAVTLPLLLSLPGSWPASVVAEDQDRPAVAAPGTQDKPGSWLPATPEKLPRWRGFNLLEKFTAGPVRRPFREEDFRLIAKLGFNFVRLPMDYRCWIKGQDWEQFDEEALRQIDQAVAWGQKYRIHVCLNFHRAPGYTVARPPEKTSLWQDADTQRVCAKHWALFARRYKGIPSARLTFNLMNEPANVKPASYAAVVRLLVEAIRREDPERLVIADGLEYGTVPVPELRALRVAQATRGYSPFELTHYKASWAGGERFALPAWPKPLAPGGVLLGPGRKAESQPLVINGPFAAATQLRLHVLTVSDRATLRVEGDGKELWKREFRCGPGKGEWKEARYRPEWKIYQNLFDKDYLVKVPAGVRQVRVRVTAGDWLEVGAVGFRTDRPGADEAVLSLNTRWGAKMPPLRYAPGAEGGPFLGLPVQDRAWLWKTCVVPWKELESRGIGVMVGEWGAYNKTPHDVVLRWAEDSLANWQKAGWGWALWNFRGSFGILDSGRADVRYEDFAGHKLDRKFLQLLQRY